MNRNVESTNLSNKNPLHASALCLKNLTRGRCVVLVSIHKGELIIATIISLPLQQVSLVPDKQGGQLIRMKHHEDGQIGLYNLAALGVIPYPIIGWSTVNFLIDFNKRRLLHRLTVTSSESVDTECPNV